MVVLITGSRTLTKPMVKQCKKIVDMCIAGEHTIISGDSVGVEAESIRYSNLREYEKVIVWGSNSRLEYGTYCGVNRLTGAAPPMRDMIMARECDLCVGILDDSAVEALITCGHAKAFGRKIKIFNFSKDEKKTNGKKRSK